MHFAAYATAISRLEAYLVRRRTGTSESEAEFLAANADLAELLSPMLEAAPSARADVTILSDPASTPPTWRGLPGEGEVIGGYRIERLLGQGGMGVVFLAQDTRLSRKVALKLVRPERLGSQPARERFWREAKLAARIEHPNICPVYEVGEAQGMPFMAMRFLAGETLAARLARDPSVSAATPRAESERKRVDDVIRVVELVARALHFAHSHGVVHRDVKPANILIEPDGTPIVLDFGMARGDDDDLGLTMTGELAGTPLYMAPEQVVASARGVDGRADVYALGVTLYEATTGVRPFSGQSMRELLDAIVEQDPPPASRHNRHLPADLDVVLEKAIEKDPARRYRTAGDFADDLARVRAHVPVLARRAGVALRARRWVQRNPVAVSFLALAAGALAVITWLYVSGAAAQRDFELVSFVRSLQELNESEMPIYAKWPDHADRLGEWSQRAQGWQKDVERVRPALARLERLGRGIERPTDRAQLFLFHALEKVVLAADAIVQPDGALARVRRNVEWIAQEHAALVADERAWIDAIAAITASLHYDSLTLRPQVGLAPLGADPVTGLWEFGHPRSGALPVRGSDGRWQMRDDTCIVFVLLPGGQFVMGAQRTAQDQPNYDPMARSGEKPLHGVTLAPFFLGKYELTQGQWMRLGDGSNPADARPGLDWAIPLTLAHPVELVTWNDCSRVLPQAGLTLPTEAQWEYAARGGTTTPWWTGAAVASLAGAINFADKTAKDRGAEWYEIDDAAADHVADGFVWHAPVDTLLPNAFGLFHICGNVWEWCRDGHARYDKAVAAGDGLRADGDGQRVLRGGAFDHAPVHARVSMRRQTDQATPSGNVGLRVARPLR